MFFADYHTHSSLSPDGQVPLSILCEHALAAGVQELCITDHCDLLDMSAQRVYSFDWPDALLQFHETDALFRGRLALKLGLEFGMGYIDPPIAQAILAQPELDFVIGSVHNLSPEKGGTDFVYLDLSSHDVCHALLDDYFSSLQLLADSPFYDVLGHIIYPFRYMNGLVSIEPYLDCVSGLLRSAISSGRGIEINTCRGRTVDEWVPILLRYRDLGGELITVGSDAHDPAFVGAGIPQTYELLRSLGFRYVFSYTKHEPSAIPL